MAADITPEGKFKRFFYTSSFRGFYITGNPDKHLSKIPRDLAEWIKAFPEDFFKLISSVNDDPLLVRRENIFYILAEALHEPTTLINMDIKLRIKETVLNIVKSDEEFFDFIKYYTLGNQVKLRNVTTALRKMVKKFYHAKQPQEFAESVTRRESYHEWAHKDMIKLCHYKSKDALCEPVISYVLFGTEKLPEADDKSKTMIDFLKNWDELRTTEDVSRTVTLINQLHATVDQVNSKLNKNEKVWLAALDEMSVRQILQCLYRFFKFGFIQSDNAELADPQFQDKVISILDNEAKVRNSKLHPVEVFIYMKVFEKGGKALDPKLIEYLRKKQVAEETLNRIITPTQPSCTRLMRALNRCLISSYGNFQPMRKRILVTIDVTARAEEICFHNRRIGFLEAAVSIARYLIQKERNVTLAVFVNNDIHLEDTTKLHETVKLLQGRTADYILPGAPIDWARNNKKSIDVFIHFMACDWLSNIPEDERSKMVKLPDVLKKYSKKMKVKDVKLVKIFLGGASGALVENTRNILSIGGFSVDVPRVLEAFCLGRF